MSEPLILSGTSEELKSSSALKILAAALVTGTPLLRKEGTPTTKPLPPVSGTLVLSHGDGVPVASASAALRLIGRLAPGSKLLGANAVEEAHVDGWLSFLWSSVELPLKVLCTAESSSAPSKKSKADFVRAISMVDRHLTYRTYLVGHSVTLADIGLVVALHSAAGKDAVWKPEAEGATPHLSRWYDTLIHQDWFQKSLASLSDLSSASTGASSSAGVSTVDGEQMMNGPSPPVVCKKYRRHRVRIKEIVADNGAAYLDKTVTVAGWARTTRNGDKKRLLFVELSDGSCGGSLQCVLSVDTTEGFEESQGCGGTGASFQMVGTIVKSQGAGQAVELQVTKAKVLGAVYGGNVEGTEVGGKLYPLSKKEHTLEHMREQAHLRPRGRVHAASMRIRHAMAFATHNFFHNHGFLYIHTPIITGADCEGAGEQFAVTTMLSSDHLKKDITLPKHEPPPEPKEGEPKMSKSEMKRLKKQQEKAKAKADPNKPQEEIVMGAVDYGKDFFAQRVNLTVSGQLNVETHACALSDVYTFGPTFRAEHSFTARHLSEFWMIEPEIAFADLSDDIDLAEDYLKYCVQFALENCADDLEFFENSPHGEKGLRDRLRNVLEKPFIRITYTEAIEILQKAVSEDGVEFEEKPVWGIDLPSEHERYICEKVFKQPVVLTDYPKDIKAFYMKLNDDEKTVAAADVLVPKIGEIIGGSQREHRMDVLKRRCEEMNLDPRSVWWYLDLRRYGTIPHAGFGLGFERMILFVTGLHNIRDVIPFPRWAGNAKF